MSMKKVLFLAFVCSVVTIFNSFGMEGPESEKTDEKVSEFFFDVNGSKIRKFPKEKYVVSDEWQAFKKKKKTKTMRLDFPGGSVSFYDLKDRSAVAKSFSALIEINNQIARHFGCEPLDFIIIAKSDYREFFEVGLNREVEYLSRILDRKIKGECILMISEETLRVCPDRFIKAILAHEYAHFIKKHTSKKERVKKINYFKRLGSSALFSFLLTNFTAYMFNCEVLYSSMTGFFCSLIGSCALGYGFVYLRPSKLLDDDYFQKHEFEADAVGALACSSIDDMIDLLDFLKNDIETALNNQRFKVFLALSTLPPVKEKKSFWSLVLNKVRGKTVFCNNHPTYEERIEKLKTLKECREKKEL